MFNRKRANKMKKNYYAIRKGKQSNIIVDTWDKCSKLVTGVSGAIFKGFEFQEDAEKFARSGHYGKYTPKPKPIKVSKQFGRCLERKSYKDPFTGQFYKNRCVLKHIATKTGIDYIESSDMSVPF